MFLILQKHSPAFVFSMAIALMFVLGAVNFNHFFRLYIVAASSSILLAAFNPLALSLFIPVKFISVPPPEADSTVLLRFRFITFAFTVCCLALALSNSALYILCCTFFVFALSLMQVFLSGSSYNRFAMKNIFLQDALCHHQPLCHFL